MSSALNDTQTEAIRQEVREKQEDWQELLSTRLPGDWKEMAVTLKAWSRTRKLRCMEDLLRALLVYAASGFSFRYLGIWATVVGVGSLSERAWRKRLQRAEAWISWLLGTLIGSRQSAGWLPKTLGRVLLVDASRWKVPAGTGDDVRMHCAYDLRAGQLVQVDVTDHHSAEGLHHFELQEGDIVVTDAGYAAGACLVHTQAKSAFGVHRESDHKVRFEREDGQKIDLKRLVKHQGYGTVTQYIVWIWDPKHKKRYQVRLVISVLPCKAAMQARARKRKQIRNRYGPKHSMAAAWWAGTLLLVTTLPKEHWSALDVVKLYRARWQIELVFKRLKQGLQLHFLQLKLWKRARIYLHLCLIVWCLQEQEAQSLYEQLTALLPEPEVGTWFEPAEEGEQEPTGVISRWGLMQCELDTILTLLHGSWSREHLQACLPLLERYLVSKPRKKRPSQDAQMQAWLSRRLDPLGKMEVAA